MTDSHPIQTPDDETTTGTAAQRIPPTPPCPRQVNLPSKSDQEDPLGLLPSFKYLEFPHSVSHAILIGMDEEGERTLPALADLFGLSIEQVQTCMEATRERLSNLIATIPPTGLKSVRNRTGKGP